VPVVKGRRVVGSRPSHDPLYRSLSVMGATLLLATCFACCSCSHLPPAIHRGHH